MWMDMVRMLLALAFIFAGAGLLFLLLTRHTNTRNAGSLPSHRRPQGGLSPEA